MIIDGKQKGNMKVVESFITTLGWFYIAVFLVQIILSLLLWYFNVSIIASELLVFPHIMDTLKVFLTTAVIASSSLVVLFLWGKYNYLRYGRLNRRRAPRDTTPLDIAAYFNLPIEEVEKYQSIKWLELEKTPV